MIPGLSEGVRPHRTQLHRQHPALAILLIGSLFVFGACAGRQAFEPAPGQTTVYRSKHYVVYTSLMAPSAEALASEFLGDSGKSWIIEEANQPDGLQSVQAIVIPLAVKNKGGLKRTGFQTIPVLTYHRFGDNCDSPLCMPADVFDRQMRYLKDNGFHTVSPEELLAFLNYRQPLPQKSVWITMDDGYRSTYNVAYPILKRYGFTATMFIYTEFVGASRLAVTWDHLRTMKVSVDSPGRGLVRSLWVTLWEPMEKPLAFISRK